MYRPARDSLEPESSLPLQGFRLAPPRLAQAPLLGIDIFAIGGPGAESSALSLAHALSINFQRLTQPPQPILTWAPVYTRALYTRGRSLGQKHRAAGSLCIRRGARSSRGEREWDHLLTPDARGGLPLGGRGRVDTFTCNHPESGERRSCLLPNLTTL